MTETPSTDPDRGALLLIEEAVHLLRRHPLPLLGTYLWGSAPFVLGLLYFWADMSRSAFAAEHCAVASMGLAVLFVWMKFWQAVFADQVNARLQYKNIYFQRRGQWLRVAATQALIQASGMVVLPLAALIMLPFGWCFAFYQNATVYGNSASPSIRLLSRRAWRQARLWPHQNHRLIGILSLFGVAVLLNVAIVLFALPHLLKTYLGMASMFTLSGANAINTTFWAACFGIGYLCVDPLIKTIYAIRCFYGEALHSGEDLKVRLRRLTQPLNVAMAMILLSGLLVPGQAGSHSDKGPGAVDPAQLERSVEEVLKQPHFTWRMPRGQPSQDTAEPKGPLAEAVEWVFGKLKQGVDVLVGWIETVVEWLTDLLPDPGPGRPSAATDWQATLRVMLILLLVFLCGVLGWILWRSRLRQTRPAETAVPNGAIATPDLGDDDICAADYPVEQWLAMAREMAEKADLRMALRALYLATLAHLAADGRITIEKHKTQRDYVRELTRRGRRDGTLTDDFRRSGLVYERVWFGMRQIAEQEYKRFSAIQQRIMASAQE